MSIHATAIVDPKAKIGKDVEIGPFCIVGPKVTLGDGVQLRSHVVIDTQVEVGDGCVFYPFSCISNPQDLKFKGEDSKVVIGKKTTIREYVTIQPGTEAGGMVTSVGDNCLLMALAHVAHDCRVGNNVIMANGATLAGHVTVGNHVVIGGLAAVLQFVRIGDHAMIGGMSGVTSDVIPYGHVNGGNAHLNGLNLIGLKRRGFERETIDNLLKAYNELFEDLDGTFAERLAKVQQAYKNDDIVQNMVAFIQDDASRRIMTPRT